MRVAGAQLVCRNRLGRDVFKRGAPEGLVVEVKRTRQPPTLYDLLSAYAAVNARVDWTHPLLQDPFGD